MEQLVFNPNQLQVIGLYSVLTWLLVPAMMLLAPAAGLLRRLTFTIVFVTVLLAVSTVTRGTVDLTAPPVKTNKS